MSVLLLMFLLPALSIGVEMGLPGSQKEMIELVGKWFTFWAIGLRLFTAGLRQAIRPAFTAELIFHLKQREIFVLVRELGYANICPSLIGLGSLFLPQWRLAAACSGGLFFGIAGINHLIRKPVSPNEWLAMISDLFIALLVAVYLVAYIRGEAPVDTTYISRPK